ncbi:hypothetical protein VMC_36340 [Vibrio alginolyticus 40B]|nr:hypothetical protein VMC_36340 [Vibrio alginolyticus 40B]
MEAVNTQEGRAEMNVLNTQLSQRSDQALALVLIHATKQDNVGRSVTDEMGDIRRWRNDGHIAALSQCPSQQRIGTASFNQHCLIRCDQIRSLVCERLFNIETYF